MGDGVYFREKAKQCRELAQSLIDQNDPTVEQLFALAAEFDAKAASERETDGSDHAAGLDELGNWQLESV